MVNTVIDASMIDEFLQAGEQLLDTGDTQGAYKIFARVTELHPSNERGWWLRSLAAKDATEALECLNQVLAINPNNLAAKDQIVGLRVHSLRSKLQFEDSPRAKSSWKVLKWRERVFPFLILLTLVTGIVCGLLALTFLSARKIEAQQPITPAVIILPATWTPTATQTQTMTPQVTWTALADSARVTPFMKTPETGDAPAGQTILNAYRPFYQGCVFSGQTLIEGTIFRQGSSRLPQSGVRVALSTSSYGFPLVVDISGSNQDQGDGHYLLWINRDTAEAGAWFVWTVKADGSPSGMAQQVQTNNLQEDNPAACQRVIVDFVS